MKRSRRTLLVGLLLVFAVASVASAQGAADRPAPLVPCQAGGTGPCVLRAEQPADVVGIWKQYLGNPMVNAPGGMGFIQYRLDGTYSLAGTAEATAAPTPPYPAGTYSFANGVMTINVAGEMVAAECRLATYYVSVFRLGDQPVALFYELIEDECQGRRNDLSVPLVWVGE